MSKTEQFQKRKKKNKKNKAEICYTQKSKKQSYSCHCNQISFYLHLRQGRTYIFAPFIRARVKAENKIYEGN